MSEFLLENASVSVLAKAMKRVTLYLTEYDAAAEVTCMVVVTTRITYFRQSKISSFNLFQGPYLQNRDFWESILWSQETKSIISDPKASKMFWCF